jgi:hypothetical protein
MLVPLGSGTCTNNNATVNGRNFRLGKRQRAYLLQDQVLGRFAWVYKGDSSSTTSVTQFRNTMSRLAKADGYELAFTGLNGSDHYTEDDDMWRRLDLRCESLITSDVTRSSPLLRDGRKEPKKLNGCKNWRKILPAKSVSNGRVSCWACWKFQMVYPELVGEGVANSELNTFIFVIVTY